VSPAGTPEFNTQLAKMTGLAYLVVALPKMTISIFGLWWFIHQLKKFTGLKVNDILKDPTTK
jgi:hypothetical protein